MWLVLLLSGAQAAVEGDVEGVEGGLPAVGPALAALPGGVQAHDRQVQALEGGLLGGEVAAGVYCAPQPGVDRLDRICRADDGPYFPVEAQEWHEFRPRVLPQPYDSRVAFLPLAGELGEPVECVRLGRGVVDRPEVFRDHAPVLFRGVLEGITQEMDNACLHDCLLPDGAHRVGQAFQSVADHHAHVPDTAVLDFRQDTQPELRSFPVTVLPGPQSQHVALAVHRDAQGQVNRPVRDLALADLDIDRVDEDYRVHRIEGAALPFCQALHDPVGNRRDRLLRYFRAVDLGQVRADLPVRQPFRRQGNHHVIDPGQPPLPFSDDFRLETGIPVPGHGDFHRPGLGDHRLGTVAIAGIAAIPARWVVPGIAKVVVHLALQGTLDHHLRQLPQQPALSGHLQPASAGPLGKLAHHLLIGRGQLRRLLALAGRHVSHWCLLHLGGYTVEITVPLAASVPARWPVIQSRVRADNPAAISGVGGTTATSARDGLHGCSGNSTEHGGEPMDMTEEHSLTQASRPTQANRWAFWGIGAGVLGIVANLVTDPIVSLTDAQKRQGSAGLGPVHRATFHIGAVAGQFLGVADDRGDVVAHVDGLLEDLPADATGRCEDREFHLALHGGWLGVVFSSGRQWRGPPPIGRW